MRILEIVSGSRINGAIKHCHDLTLQLRARGHQMLVACRPDTWMSRQIQRDGIDVIASDLHRWPSDEIRRMAAEVQRRQIDVIHTHMSRAHFFGVLLSRFAKVPVVATAHSRNFQLHWMFNDFVIAVSDATRNFHIRRNFVGRHNIQTIYNFVDLPNQYHSNCQLRGRLHACFGIPADSPLITFVGAIEKRKGLVHLVAAMQQVIQRHPNAHLLVVGPANKTRYPGIVRQQVAAVGVGDRIHFLGRRDDVREVLAASDVFVLPSLEESFPLTILEAMSVGKPVVATDVGGVAECVVAGQTGLLVKPADPDPLANALSHLLENPALATRMGQHGRQRIHDCFTPHSQLPKIERVLENVTSKRSGAVRAAA